MALTPCSAANSTSRPLKKSTRTFDRCLVTSRRRSCRSSRVNSGSAFCGLRMTATMSSSKCWAVRSMMSRWPFVTGSNDPGMSAIATLVRLSFAGYQVHHGTAVALRSHDAPWRRDLEVTVGLGHHEVGADAREHDIPPVERVGRVDEREVIGSVPVEPPHCVCPHHISPLEPGRRQIGAHGGDGSGVVVDKG